jgi:type IV pilus assembly protein PilM
VLSTRHKGWIGVDLGTSAIKLAQVERAGRTPSGGWAWRLAHARVIRRETAPGDETPAQQAAVDWWSDLCHGKRLRDGFSGRRTACVLPAAQVDLRAIQLPDGSEAEHRAMIANEIEGLADDGAGRRVFDFWDVRPPEQSKLENVQVLSLPENEAVAVVANLSRAGLRCRVIDGLPLAVARAVALADGANDARGDETSAAVGALDWGATSATFSVLWEHRPVFTRQFRDCGFAAVPAAVSQALGLSIADAERLLTTHGVCDPAGRNDPLRDVQEVITDVTGGLLNEIVSQLNKTLAYPELHRSGLVPERIWLLGGGATVKNLAALLSAKIHRNVETWRLEGMTTEGCGISGACGRSTDHSSAISHSSSSAAPAAMLGPAIALSVLAFAV